MERTPGKWRIRYQAPPDETGKRGIVSETIAGRRRDAERLLRERIGTVDKGTYVARSDETVSEFLERWVESYVAGLEPSTRQGYRHYVDRHIVPAIGGVRLQGLRTSHVQALYSAMLVDGLSKRTVKHCSVVLKGALKLAVDWGDLVRNPADSAKAPKPDKILVVPWKPESFNAFIEAAKESIFRDVYWTATTAGLRRSELCGLKWDKVDLDDAEIEVSRKLIRITGRGLVEGFPKTEQSRRTLEASRIAVDVLRRVKVEQAERQLKVGSLWQGDGHVFTDELGRPFSGERLSKDFTKIVRRESLPHLTLNGLRHTFVSLLIAGGVHPRVIADMVGHSSISTTMDTYGHLFRGAQRAAVEELDRRLLG